MTLKSKETGLESAREQRKLISGEIAAKDKEIEEVAAQIEVKSEALKKLSKKVVSCRKFLKKGTA